MIISGCGSDEQSNSHESNATVMETNFDTGIKHYQSGNYTEAVRYFRLAAEQGHAGAQYNLGVCYTKGYGVTQNNNEAVRYYRLAAEQGHAGAQYNLGLCYFNGYGVTQNYIEAVKYFRLAAEQGHAEAIGSLRQLGRQ